MPSEGYIVRAMSRKDLDAAIEWAAAEGWNPGLSDGDAFYRADPGGFLIGELDGEPVGCISAVSYGDEFGFIGFYIVRPGFRGKGFGIELWRAAMKRLAGRNIGLDGVVAQQENYKRSGFSLAYKNIRYEGVCSHHPASSFGLAGIGDVSLDAILEYDDKFFPVPRRDFMKKWLDPDGRRFVAFVHGGAVMGFGAIRKCRKGFKIGPLFAETEEIAGMIFNELIKTAGSETVVLDVPELNAAAVKLAESHKMTISFETARMYTGEFYKLPFGKLYGVTTFELG